MRKYQIIQAIQGHELGHFSKALHNLSTGNLPDDFTDDQKLTGFFLQSVERLPTLKLLTLEILQLIEEGELENPTDLPIKTLVKITKANVNNKMKADQELIMRNPNEKTNLFKKCSNIVLFLLDSLRYTIYKNS